MLGSPASIQWHAEAVSCVDALLAGLREQRVLFDLLLVSHNNSR